MLRNGPGSTDMDAIKADDDKTVETENTSTDSRGFIRLLNYNNKSQSDTGANQHLTNIKHVIQSFTPMKPFSIGTIDKDSLIMVTGKGYTSIKTTNPQKPLIYETLYSAKASGSVFSPEKYASDNKDHIDFWCQWGTNGKGMGAIVFYGFDRKPKIIIPLYRRKGLWYMKIAQPE